MADSATGGRSDAGFRAGGTPASRRDPTRAGSGASGIPASWLEIEKRLAEAVKGGELAAALTTVDLAFRALRWHSVELRESYYYVHRMLALMTLACEEVGVSVEEPGGWHAKPYGDLYALDSMDGMRAWLMRHCRRIVNVARGAVVAPAGRKTGEAVALIRARYADPSLSLTRLCRMLAISPSYFCLIFKAHTGKTFLDYLTTLRMEHAKALLARTALRHSEIAARVGYADPHYFSSAFKRETGMCPSRYRDAEAARTGSPASAAGGS
jgi:two-component system response regulator YesN